MVSSAPLPTSTFHRHRERYQPIPDTRLFVSIPELILPQKISNVGLKPIVLSTLGEGAIRCLPRNARGKCASNNYHASYAFVY